MKERALAVLMAVMLSFSLGGGVFVTAGAEASGAPNTAISVLTGLDIMRGIDESNFGAENEVTRAQVCTVLIRALGYEGMVDGNREATYFTDVPLNHWALGEINLAYQMGIIAGAGDRMLRPEETARYEEIVKIVVSALGYRIQAEQAGGYPVGYLTTASKLGLMKGVARRDSGTVTRGDLARMLYNALDVPFMDVLETGGNISYSEGTDTMLSRLHLTYGKGVVTATENTGLTQYSTPARRGYVKLDGEDFLTDMDMTDFIGCNIGYYYREAAGDENVLLAVVPPSGYEKLELDANQLLSGAPPDSLNELYYEGENGKKERASLKEGVLIIYNGKAADADPAYLSPASGALKLVGSGGEYDIVHVTDRKAFVVSGVSEWDERIYLQDATFNGDGYIKLETGSGTKRHNITKKGVPTKLADIPSDVAISVTASLDQGYIDVEILEAGMKGTVSEVRQDSGGEDTVVINEKQYRLARGCVLDGASSVNVGDSVSFYLDASGDIFHLKANAASERNYGYVMKAQTAGGVSDVVLVKMLTATGEIKEMQCRNRVSVVASGSGTDEMMSGQALVGVLAGKAPVERDLIAYETNERNEITKIILPEDKSAAADIEDALDGKYEDRFARAWTLEKQSGYFGYGRLISGNYNVMLANDVKVFVPAYSEETDTFNDELATVTGSSYFSSSNSSQTFRIKVYDVDEMGRAAAVLSVADAVASSFKQEEWSITVVDSISQGLDEEGNPIKILNGYLDGNRTSWPIHDMSRNKQNDGKLLYEPYRTVPIEEAKQGDVMMFETSDKGEIMLYRFLYRTADPAEGWICVDGGGYSQPKASGFQIMGATVLGVDGSTLKLGFGTNRYAFKSGGDFQVYVISGKTGEIRIGKSAEVKKDDRVLMQADRNAVKAVVIYED